VAQGITHEREPAQDHVAADDGAYEPHDRRGDERADEEREGQRIEDGAEQVQRRPSS
jgi:hypothetical protein